MVFGALLGGAVTRAGERFQEAAERQRRVEDWQRQNALGLQLDFFTKNYGNMTPEQHEAQIKSFAPLVGMKPKDLSSLIGGAKAIGSVIPPQYMDAKAMGAPRSTTGSLAVTPSKEPAVRGIEAPASIEIGQIPQPADIGTPSIYAPTTGHRATLPSQTPNEVLAERKLALARQQRQQNIGDIRGSGLRPELQELGIANEYGIKNVGSYEVGMAGVDQRRAAADQRFTAAAQKMTALYKDPNIFKRGDQNVFVWDTPQGPVTIGPTGEPERFIPQSTDTMASPVAQGKGSDFAQYVARMEGELGRSLTAAEVQQARNRFPDAPVIIKTKINGQDVELVKTKSGLLGASTPPSNRTATPPAAPRAAVPPQGKSTTTPKKSAAPQIGAVPNINGLAFPSQTSASEDKLGDEYELSHRKVADIESTFNPEFTGAVRGGTIDYALRSKFPEAAKWLGRPDISAQESTFRAMNESMKNSIMHLLSGAAVSPSESKRILAELPDPSNPGSWEGKMLTTKRNSAYLLNRIRERQGKSGVTVPQLPTGGPNIIDSSKGMESDSSGWTQDKRARYEEWKRRKAGGR